MTFFGLVRRVIAARKSCALQLAAVLLAMAVATGIRWFTDRGSAGMPFVTFVPVVVLAAIFLETRYAILAALLSLAAVVTLFGPHARIQFTVPNYFLWFAFTFVTVFMIATGHVLRQTIVELDLQAERTRAFNAELQHRTKNMLQMVRALASRAARSTDPVEFYNTLAGRLDALAKANELLGPGNLHSRDLADLVAVATEPFPAWAIVANGPPVRIAGDPGMKLIMALHELGTNAMKYGALSVHGLSVHGGRVAITWTVQHGTVELRWEESGGPSVVPPRRKGLGSRILSPSGTLHAVDLDFRPSGLVCRLVVSTNPPG
jgi:two-component sensor histidine kinase